jgi:DNA-binding NarL/FixJ family response regulator
MIYFPSQRTIGGVLVQSTVRVLLVDDSEVFRFFTASTLRGMRGFEVVAEAQDGLEAIELAAKMQPDVVLLDVYLPKLNGIEAARHIRRISPDAVILFLSADSSPVVAREAFSVGGMGYVVKWQAAQDLMPALEAVLQGEQFISDSVKGSTSIRDCELN